jgi:hypothetical protein
MAPTLEFDAGVLAGAATRPYGSTSLRLTGHVTAHVPSSAKVAIEGAWTETVDRGFGPVLEEEPRHATVGSVAVNPGDPAPWPFDLKQVFGDCKRRRVTYRAAATTHYREFFPGLKNERTIDLWCARAIR